MDYTSWQVISDTAEYKSERLTVLKHANIKHVLNTKINTKQFKHPNHIPGTGHSYTMTEESADTLQTIPKHITSMAMQWKGKVSQKHN